MIRPLPSTLGAAFVAALAFSCPTRAAGALDDEPDTSGWFVRLGGRLSTGPKVSLLDNRPTTVLPAGQYDNGFVHPDVSGSAATTWNWGYSNDSQVQGGVLTLNRTDFGSPYPRVPQQSNLSDSPLYGGELVGGFEFVRFDFRKREARLGFELGYSYSQLSISSSRQTTGNLTYTTDQYPLNGVVPPSAPYAGSYSGPGPLLGLNPSSHTVTPSAATDTMTSRITATLHNFRFGPWVSLPFTSRFSLGVSAGYAAILTDPQWQLTDVYTVANPAVPAPTAVTGRYSHTHFVPGAFGQVRAEYRLTTRLTGYVGVDAQYNTGLSVLAPQREARFDFGSQFGGVLGLSWAF